VSVHEQLLGFVMLQRLLDQRTTLRRERDTPPEDLATLRAASAERAARSAELDERRDALAAEQGALQREADVLREERDHFRRQKSQVTNMKQLAAVVSELDFVEVQLKGKEDRLLEIWQELEGLNAKRAELAAESPEEHDRRVTAEEAWESRRAEADVGLTRLEDELRLTQRQLGGDAMATFKKLWNSRKPLAVVPLDGTACSACHAELRPSLVQQVRSMETLGVCDTCRRLLYDPEKLPT
jgi:uncharacterized protein